MTKKIKAGVLEVAYEESGPADGTPVVLLHGFPYDVHAYDEVAHILAREGLRVIVPYLRGYGPTRFLSKETPRSGQQAVLAHDLRDLMDALGVRRALIGGFDWGGRSCCIAAALWPERVMGVVLGGGYTIQDIAASGKPIAPERELLWWYQYYMHGELQGDARTGRRKRPQAVRAANASAVRADAREVHRHHPVDVRGLINADTGR